MAVDAVKVDRVEADIAVVGGGIAGVSVAAELSREPGMRIALLEREGQLAYHASGRSAATFLESYGSAEIRALTRASRAAFGDADHPLLTPRPLLWLAPAGQVSALRALLDAEPRLREISEEDVRRLCPAVRPGWAELAGIEDGAQDLDVAGLFEKYRRLAVTNHVSVHLGVSIVDGTREAGGWVLRTGSGDARATDVRGTDVRGTEVRGTEVRGTEVRGTEVRATMVVNAAGAWADDVARRCGVAPLGLTPYRRTVAVVTSADVDRAWPLVCDIGETFYFRPEGSGLLVSPADQTPTEPVDARPQTEDVALALDRVNEATTLKLRRVLSAWAGLRTFSPDRNPVVGPDPAAEGFFWLAGQGGYGMQTAPALATLAASLLLGHPMPDELAREGVDAAPLTPARFR